MDELNLAARFGRDDENDQRPNRRKRPLRLHTGVGMEKPEEPVDSVEDDIGGVETEPGERSPAEKTPRPELEPEEGEDEAFADLVSRLEGESASEGRARKRRAKPVKPGNDSLRAEFADRM